MTSPPWTLDRLVRAGVASAYVSAAFSIVAFILVLMGPRDDAERATSPVSLTAGVLDWLAVPLALVFLVGLVAAANSPRGAGTAAGVVALVVTAAAVGPHIRFLVEHASYGVNVQFAQRLHDTQSVLAETLFGALFIAGTLSWVAVAVFVAPEAGLGRAGRIATGLVGLGLLLPIPVMALALLVAARSFAGSAKGRHELPGGADVVPTPDV